jgi:hypothetical protein
MWNVRWAESKQVWLQQVRATVEVLRKLRWKSMATLYRACPHLSTHALTVLIQLLATTSIPACWSRRRKLVRDQLDCSEPTKVSTGMITEMVTRLFCWL